MKTADFGERVLRGYFMYLNKKILLDTFTFKIYSSAYTLGISFLLNVESSVVPSLF
jgi:hypothetical protein